MSAERWSATPKAIIGSSTCPSAITSWWWSSPGSAGTSEPGLTLALNQTAVVDLELVLAALSELVEVSADAPLINTTSAEVGLRFDAQRVAELRDEKPQHLHAGPLGPQRQRIASGQKTFASGTAEANFSSNGARLRSNNVMIDGQDSSGASVTGRRRR